ncbi:MAG: type VI secretion system baseplate subunit TssF [Deltaproteobacteria bacterium]|nr:type VI secretion system baseplate subunit TssF [Deltaproteobacteria bacterium]
MFNRHFQQELANLRELGKAFCEAHPAVAPMLSGPTADPDVERLLEGVAFLTGLLREKLDDDFPEIVHELTRLIWPHYLRPIPCTTIIAFRPKPTVKERVTIPAGVQVASVEVEETRCLFQTCYPVDLYPLRIRDASYREASGRPASVRIRFELLGPKLCDWQPKALRFHLAGGYGDAADLYLLLRKYVKQIVIEPSEGGSPLTLSAEHLRPVGFSDDEQLIPYPGHSFPAYRIIQEYFMLPEKFLFLDLVGWEDWQNRGEGTRFEIRFELAPLPFQAPRIGKEHFVLAATPAVNIFPYDADPIRLDHRLAEYPIRPAGAAGHQYQVYALESVTGFVQGTAEERAYVPFEIFNPNPESTPVYHVKLRKSPIEGSYKVFLSVAYPKQAGPPSSETLSIRLLCTNGSLPESLQVGDISVPASSSPEFAEFENIRPPTANVLPPLEANLLWRLLSHLSLNYLSLGKAENLRALLELYIFPETRDRTTIVANQRRIAGIDDVQIKASNRLVSGIMMRGQEVVVSLRQDHFACPGDLFLFGSMLDAFMGAYASMNSYTQLFVHEVLKGDRYQWPARVGDHPLM